ncbi:hypothetical protein MAR_014665, partial [Mya arenaria]
MADGKQKRHHEIEQIVLRKALLKDIQKLSPEGQTSGLEGFHSLVCGFCHQDLHFHHAQMEVRMLMLPCIGMKTPAEHSKRLKMGDKCSKLVFPMEGNRMAWQGSERKADIWYTIKFSAGLLLCVNAFGSLAEITTNTEKHMKKQGWERNKLEEERKRPQPMADGKQKRGKAWRMAFTTHDGSTFLECFGRCFHMNLANL